MSNLQTLESDLPAVALTDESQIRVPGGNVLTSALKAFIRDGLATSDAVATVASTLNLKIPRKSGLQNWWTSAKRLILSGDSTTANAVALWTALKNELIAGGLLEGVTLLGNTDLSQQAVTAPNGPQLGHGSNGMTLATMLALPASNRLSIESMAALNPSLIIFSWLINDVRNGLITLEQAIALLEQLVTRTRALLPNCDIILRIPLALGTDNDGYISGITAQAATDIIRNAYFAMRDRWPNVVVLDTQTEISGTISRAQASNPLMADALHPDNEGQAAVAAAIFGLIGERKKAAFNPSVAIAARAAHYANAYAYYAQEVEDTSYYDLIASGQMFDSGSNYFRFDFPGSRIAELSAGDLFVCGNAAPFPLMGGGGLWSDYVQWNMALPAPFVGLNYAIYRHKFAHNAKFESILKAKLANPYTWLGTAGYTANGQIQLFARSGELASIARTATVAADTLVFADGAEFSLTGVVLAVIKDICSSPTSRVMSAPIRGRNSS